MKIKVFYISQKVDEIRRTKATFFLFCFRKNPSLILGPSLKKKKKKERKDEKNFLGSNICACFIKKKRK